MSPISFMVSLGVLAKVKYCTQDIAQNQPKRFRIAKIFPFLEEIDDYEVRLRTGSGKLGKHAVAPQIQCCG